MKFKEQREIKIKYSQMETPQTQKKKPGPEVKSRLYSAKLMKAIRFSQ